MSHLFSLTLLMITKTQQDIIAFVFLMASHNSLPRFLQFQVIFPELPGGDTVISGSVAIITSFL